jgi:pimeloyl-ACP methyl ester carboxylesterase
MTSATRTRPAPATDPASARVPAGRVIAAAMVAGVGSAAVLVFGVLPGARESTIIGATFAAFAVAWALLARLTIRLTALALRWAYLPAALLAAASAFLLLFTPVEPTMTQLAWVWAPALAALGVFVAWRTRRTVAGLPAVTVYAVALAMLLSGLGGLLQVLMPAPEAAAGAMPGRLVDVGGYRLHISCTGSGSPTVVMLNGLGETSPQWERVDPAIARTTRVCVYDRAGQGWSDDSSNPADATSAATDLHRLLAAAGETGPFVLAGHSLGGVHALAYAAMYPHDVAGVVLLDSASPHQVDVVKSFTGEYEVMRRVLAVLPTLFRFGIGHILQAMTPSTPGTAAAQSAAFANSPRGMQNMRAEQEALPVAFAQAQAVTTLGRTPLVVLTAKDNVDHKPGWGTAQGELARLSTNSRHTVANLDHMAFLDDPAGSALSVEAIGDVIASVRSHVPLRTR